MAKMVPDFIDPSVVASERRVFAALRSASGGQNWTVLHALGLSSDWSGEFGEIDFLVIMPGAGIVCVEVKGGAVSVRNGVWTTRNRRGHVETLKRSPYRQAQEGMWKFLTAIRARFGLNSLEAKCPAGWLVVFADVACPPVTPEATREEVIDRGDMEKDIGARLSNAPSLTRLSSRSDLTKPTPATCARIANFLRPEFERVAAPVSTNWEAETRIRVLTEEQFEALDAICDNPICLLRGPAGTGKTLLGIESARRAAAAGRNVLVLCFNHNLGSWLAVAVDHFGPGCLVAGNVHALLRARIMKSSLASDLVQAEASGMDGKELFGRLYYELGALAIEESGERFDDIVFDEVQDLPARALGDLVGAWTRGGENFRVLLLGDFTRQALYTGASTTSVPMLEALFGHLPVFNLRLNCRNTRRIALQTGILSGFGEQRVSDRQPEGEQVSIQYYAGKGDGLGYLERIVKLLRESGQKVSEVVILGPRRRETSLVGNTPSIGGWAIRDLAEARPGDVAYSTIHAFKGLERSVVIIIDAEAASVDESDALLYVAMSRARLRLFILAPQPARGAIEQRLTLGAIAAAGLRQS
jgi:nuclease-like protein/UvrD-like helicase family protein/AAA domain-containing protein